MARQRTERPPRRMKPLFLIFCEGETEETYLDYLKQAYRSPIKIISKIEGGDLSQRLIAARQKELKISKNDKVLVFLMYDMDVPVVNERLMKCNAYKMLSNPTIELWFLLHGKDCKSPMTSEQVLSALKESDSIWEEYQKASLTDTQKNYLWKHRLDAAQRAKALENFSNPSSGVFNLILALEKSLKR